MIANWAFNYEAITGLLKSGWQTIKGAIALPLMSQGYERGLICFCIVCANK